MIRKSANAFVLVLLLFITAGCGDSRGTVKVTGKVTVDGQPPPGAGTVTFTVAQPGEGFPVRPAMAKFAADGSYTATTYEPGDGLLPGTYKVAVECYETPPNMEGKPVKSYIAEKFMNGETSGFELVVEANSAPIEFNIPVTK